MISFAKKAILYVWRLPRRMLRKITTDPFRFPTIRMANRGLKFLASEPFKGLPFDQKKHDAIMSREPADTRYVIFFTPRSGSSRLTDLLTRTGRMGRPDEVFNPDFTSGIATAYSARNMRELVALILRGHTTGRVFGCEVTYVHLFFAFWSGRRFLKAIDPTSTAWLIREDIVAQAVSISRMIQTDVSHSVEGDGEDHRATDDRFYYHPKQIKSAIARIRWMESQTEKMIARHRLQPLRLSYEQCVGMPENDLVRKIADHVGVALPPSEVHGTHRRVSGNKSQDIAERFRQEHPTLVTKLDKQRASMLAALQK